MSTVWCLCYLFYIMFTYFAVLNAARLAMRCLNCCCCFSLYLKTHSCSTRHIGAVTCGVAHASQRNGSFLVSDPFPVQYMINIVCSPTFQQRFRRIAACLCMCAVLLLSFGADSTGNYRGVLPECHRPQTAVTSETIVSFP